MGTNYGRINFKSSGIVAIIVDNLIVLNIINAAPKKKSNSNNTHFNILDIYKEKKLLK